MKSFDENEIINRIKKERKAREFTQESFAEIVGVDRRTIQRLEKRLTDTELVLIKVISKLEVSADYILYGIEDNNDKCNQLKEELREFLDNYH